MPDADRPVDDFDTWSTHPLTFTQYVAPHGYKRQCAVEVLTPVYDRAKAIMALGLAFECEVLSTGDVSLTITHPDNGDIDIRVVPNGPAVLDAVNSLVMEFDLEGVAA
jgi:hypothetical protein